MGSPERRRRAAAHMQASAATAIEDSAFFVEPRILRCPEREMATMPVGCGPPSQQAQAMTEQPTVIIVDDAPGIREALGSPIRSVGVQAKALTSVPEFLNEGRPDGPTCLRLDRPSSRATPHDARPAMVRLSTSSSRQRRRRYPRSRSAVLGMSA
jgi:hypothetical protein